MVRPAAPGSRSGLIPIGPGSVVMPKGRGKTDPDTFWLKYYRSNDPRRTDPEQLRETLRALNLNGKTRDAQAALKGFLKNHPKDAQSWMYRALALAIEENQGSPADIKTALNAAADTAQRSHNPNDLVGAADGLFRKGYYERVGPLLDETMAKVPHRWEPPVMSINLAQKSKDPAGWRRRRTTALSGLARAGRVFSHRVSKPGGNLGQVAAGGWAGPRSGCLASQVDRVRST